MDEPDGYMIRHSRSTDELFFGPFVTREEAVEWFMQVGEPQHAGGRIVPLYKTVDWNRRGF
jgi:hypothetical protein